MVEKIIIQDILMNMFQQMDKHIQIKIMKKTQLKLEVLILKLKTVSRKTLGLHRGYF